MLFDPERQITKLLQCPDCGIDMDFLVHQSTNEVFLSSVLKRQLFVCPDCGRLGYKSVLLPKQFITFEAA